MAKSVKVNVNEILLDDLNERQKTEIEEEVKVLNSIDNLFPLVIALFLAITFVGSVIASAYYAYLMIIVSLLCITTISYTRYARSKQKKKLKRLLEQTTMFDNHVKIKIVSYHEKVHTIAMYVLLISLVFSLINSTLDILFK